MGINQALDQVGHVKFLASRNVLAHFRLKKVNSRVNKVLYLGLLRHAKDVRSVALDHAVWNLEIVPAHPDGQAGFMLSMVPEHRSEIYVCQDVSIDHQQRLAVVLQQSKGAGRAERLILLHIVNVDPEALSIAEVVRNGLRLVMRR